MKRALLGLALSLCPGLLMPGASASAQSLDAQFGPVSFSLVQRPAFRAAVP